jgi:hypothetical protein
MPIGIATGGAFTLARRIGYLSPDIVSLYVETDY